MAYIDLSTYDVLDLMPVAGFSDEQKGDYLYQFVSAYGGYLSECLGSQFTEEDSIVLDALLEDEDATVAEVENFFKERIPNYEELLQVAAVKFKKTFLLEFYNRMLKATKEANHYSASFWEEIIKEAEADNWDIVFGKIRELEAKDREEAKTPASDLPVSAPATSSLPPAPAV